MMVTPTSSWITIICIRTVIPSQEAQPEYPGKRSERDTYIESIWTDV